MSERLYDPSGKDITDKVKKSHATEDRGVTKVKTKNPNPIQKIPVKPYKGRDWSDAPTRTGP